LLRVLETRTVKRVGGAREIGVDVRLIAATNTPLDTLVARQQLRSDLFFRLDVFRIDIPPLRERKEDILPLARHFLLTQFVGRHIAVDGFSPAAEELLLGHDYSGNVRELRNIVERAAMLRRSGLIQAEDIRLAGASSPPPAPPSPPTEPREKDLIRLALERTHWNRQRAAASLDLPYSTLRYKIKKYGIA
jgi:DNA-binding NtrC family response regulator